MAGEEKARRYLHAVAKISMLHCTVRRAHNEQTCIKANRIVLICLLSGT